MFSIYVRPIGTRGAGDALINGQRRAAGGGRPWPGAKGHGGWERAEVKGHSKEEGNDAADKMAGYAQNGGAKNVQDVAMMMGVLRMRT